jgi:DNA-binding NtrC family response regulator
MKIVVVANSVQLRDLLQEGIRLGGHEAVFCTGVTHPAADSADLIFLEWEEGIRVPSLLRDLETATARQPPVPVVVLVPAGGVTAMRRAQAVGAADVLFSPPELNEIKAEIEEIGTTGPGDSVDAKRLEEIARETLIGESPAFRRCLNELKLAARCDANVLLMGATGTGKEMFARAIHQLSRRSGNRYLPVDCGGLPEALLENELFGSVKGAFTGATADHAGRFELVGAGTLLLDEVGNLSVVLQTKLLRAIEERVFQRVGSNENVQFHGRLICATSVELDKATGEGQFRRDLLGRIDQFRIVLPPLRERRIDVPILAEHFLSKHARGRIVEISRSVIDLLESYDFPGNIRQLENSIISALAHSKDGAVILPRHLPKEIVPSTITTQGTKDHVINVPCELSYKAALEHVGMQIDRLYLPRLLAKHQGNQRRAAEEAGIDRGTFAAKMKGMSSEGRT